LRSSAATSSSDPISAFIRTKATGIVKPRCCLD
jgi:hypothetical protein